MTAHEPERTDRAGVHQPLDLEPLRVTANHERLADHDAVAIARVAQLPRLVGRHRDGLLAQHVLSRVRRAHRPWNVQVIRQRIVDDVDVAIGDQLLVRPVSARNAAPRRR